MTFYYTQYIDLSEIKDLVQIDWWENFPIIASLETGDAWVYLEVCGENEIVYQGKTYRDYMDFPDELKELIKNNDKWWNDDDVELLENQYLDLCYKGETGKDYWNEEFDIQGKHLQPNQIFNVLYDFYKKTRGEAR